MDTIESLEKIIDRIQNIHYKYLDGVINSVSYLSPKIIEKIKNFNIKKVKDVNLLCTNLDLLNTKFYDSTASGTRKINETKGKQPKSSFPQQALNVVAIILTCYGLDLFERNIKELEVSENESDEEDKEYIDVSPITINDDVQNFILLYLLVYRIIKFGEISNYSEDKICNDIKESFPLVKCNDDRTTIELFLQRLTAIFQNQMYRQGYSQWQYKYLKYKKKYLNIKKM